MKRRLVRSVMSGSWRLSSGSFSFCSSSAFFFVPSSSALFLFAASLPSFDLLQLFFCCFLGRGSILVFLFWFQLGLLDPVIGAHSLASCFSLVHAISGRCRCIGRAVSTHSWVEIIILTRSPMPIDLIMVRLTTLHRNGWG